MGHSDAIANIVVNGKVVSLCSEHGYPVQYLSTDSEAGISLWQCPEGENLAQEN